MKDKQTLLHSIRKESLRLFDHNDNSVMVRSPGRVNLIGEHTDYNEGFVLPSAIDKAIYLLVAPNKGFAARLHSLDFDESFSFDVRSPERSGKQWANYLIGVVDQLRKFGYHIGGFDCVFAGDVPIGAGMSSSAALEMGIAFSLNEIYKFGIEPSTLAKIGQKSENEFVGVKCGIMDQFANILSKGESALLLDCRSLNYEPIPFTRTDLKFVLCDTGVKHSLAASEYNLRRQQCEAGVEAIQKDYPNTRSLRDINHELLEQYRDRISTTIYNRCSYVLEENDRVQAARKSLMQNDYEEFGRLMYRSHDGLRTKYEVSCAELDLLVETASKIDGVLGARMMGGGFGGCTLNLVQNESVEKFDTFVSEVYLKQFGRRPKIYECSLMPGTSVEEDLNG